MSRMHRILFQTNYLLKEHMYVCMLFVFLSVFMHLCNKQNVSKSSWYLRNRTLSQGACSLNVLKNIKHSFEILSTDKNFT